MPQTSASRIGGASGILGGASIALGACLLATRPPGVPGGSYREVDDITPLLLAAMPLIVGGAIGLTIREGMRAGMLGKSALSLTAAAVALLVLLSVALARGAPLPWTAMLACFAGWAIGSLLIGVAAIRAAVLPRWAGLILILGALLLFAFNTEDARAWLAVPYGLAWIVVGTLLVDGRGYSTEQRGAR